ncbi:MAG: DUF4268 domain-containing protein [Burkholderiales bacterium]|nr:DUF4268 domain-containing protein [Burkholderiales bacterium]
MDVGIVKEFGVLELCDDLRSEGWPDEAKDFTPWLAEHLSMLGEVTDLEFEGKAKTEQVFTTFRADIVTHTIGSNSKTVVIENQLTPSDHDHLGKLLTYASCLDARILIWIVKEVADEHCAAVRWLNDNTGWGIEIYLVQLQLWRIGDSKVAPKFVLIEGPSWDLKEKRLEKLKADSSQEDLVREFWKKFNAEVFSRNNRYRSLIPLIRRTEAKNNYKLLGNSNSKRQIMLFINWSDQSISLRMYINGNNDWFRQLKTQKATLEELAGTNRIDWTENPKRSHFQITRPNSPLQDTYQWNTYIDWFYQKAIAAYNFVQSHPMKEKKENQEQ